VNWSENGRRCCTIGMTPISFETQNEFDCLQNLAKGASFIDKINHVYVSIFSIAGNWPHNWNYWTSGRRIIANDTFQWCSSSQADGTFTNASTMWAAKQPDNTNGTKAAFTWLCANF